jgi:hypothetical protein
MTEIGFDAADLLVALTSDQFVFQSVERLAGQLGAEVAELVARFGEMAAAGLVEWWEHPTKGLGVCLSALTAGQLGLEMADDGRRWVPAGSDEEPPRLRHRPRRVLVESDMDDPGDPVALDELPDPGAADPAEAVAAAEDVESRAPRKRSRADYAPALPRPTVLLGERLQWQGPRWAESKPCPGCRGRRLTAARYCLVCERWGLDFLVPSRPAGARTRYERGRLKGGLG